MKIQPAYAGLFDIASALSSNRATQTAVAYSLAFTIPSSNNLQELQLRFSANSGGFVKPQHLGLTNSSLASGTIFGVGGWGLDTSDAANGLLRITRPSSVAPATRNGTITLNNVTNPSYGDCESIAGTLSNTCFIELTTYIYSGDMALDTGSASFQINEDPSLSFTISGVQSGETHNGITTTVDTTGSIIHFGNIQAGSPQYAAQKLSIATNAPHGYAIYARLEDGMRGMYADSKIDPFSGLNAAWSNPQFGSSPNGTVANENTGWIGANTSDARVNGWQNNTQRKFGPVSAIDHIVAYSESADRTGTDVYVTYALEVNGAQPSDDYTASIVYDVVASY